MTSAAVEVAFVEGGSDNKTAVNSVEMPDGEGCCPTERVIEEQIKERSGNKSGRKRNQRRK